MAQLSSQYLQVAIYIVLISVMFQQKYDHFSSDFHCRYLSNDLKCNSKCQSYEWQDKEDAEVHGWRLNPLGYLA